MEERHIHFTSAEVPEGLLVRIVFNLRKCELRRERTRAFSFAALALTALVAVVPAFENVSRAATESGFVRYASLIFSDWSVVVSLWKIFALSLAETAPAFAIAVCAGTLLVFVWSAGQALRYTKAIRLGFNY